MKNYFKAALIGLLIPLQALAGLPPTTIKGQQDSTKSVKFDFRVPGSQATSTSSTSALIETGNKNLLANPSFEHSTYSTSWTIANSSGSAETSTILLPGTQSAKLALSAQSGDNLTQSTTVTPASGQNYEATCNVNTSLTTAQVCALQGGSETGCVSASGAGTWQPGTINFVTTGGTVGVKVKTTSSSTGNIYVDDCYVGPARNLGLVSPDTDWVSSTCTSSWTANTTTTCKYRRVGDTAEIQWTNALSGAPTAATLTFSYPSGLVADTTKMTGTPATSFFVDGHVQSNRGGTGTTLVALYGGTTSVIIAYTNNVTTSSQAVTNATAPVTWASGDFVTAVIRVPVVGWTASSSQAFTPSIQSWKVDASISGANPSLGTANVSSYTGVEDGSLTLTNNTGGGNLTAQIPCSSTNAPSGTTCATGNESVGVSFVLPKAGDVLACASFTHGLTTAAVANSGGGATFQIVETATNSQTIVQEGKSRTNSYIVVPANTAMGAEYPFRVCGNFTFASAGQKVLRLMYEQLVQGSGLSASDIKGDQYSGLGQRDIHWEVYPITQNVPAPVLVGSVTSNSSGAERVERLIVDHNCTSTPCTIASQSGSWVSSVARSATGTYQVNIASGIFSARPTCVATSMGSGYIIYNYSINTSSVVYLAAQNFASALVDGGFNLTCMGPR